jgi:hypothetical protein
MNDPDLVPAIDAMGSLVLFKNDDLAAACPSVVVLAVKEGRAGD